MARSGSVRVNIDADASGMKRGVNDAERSLARLHTAGTRSLKGLGIAATATGAVAFTGLAAAIATGTREMLAQQKVSAQTAAVIKSTGAAANVTSKDIEALSSALQAQTGVADDAIQSHANLLLTFTNVRNEAGRGNDVFNQATKTILDMSVALGQDGKSSAIQLGKALNDPIAGISALSRVGVTFTKQQKEQIATLTEGGKRLDAQKVILRELAKEFGGSAAAQANTTAGQLARIQRAWEDVSEGLVREFLPIITDVAKSVLRNMDKVKAIFDGVAVFVKGTIKFIKALFEGDWKKAWDIAADGAGKSLKAIGVLAEKVLLPLGRKLGRAIIQGVGEGVSAGLARLRASLPGGTNGVIATALFGDVSSIDLGASVSPITGVDRRPVQGPGIRRAMGGFIPGRFDGRDDIPVSLSRGEVVLNPTQQRIVGLDRIVSTLRSTGGVVGGQSFATGGVVGGAVSAAAGRARGNLGEPYGKPSRGESRTGPNSWDCSGYATYVAGVNVGGTTSSAYTSSSRAQGTEPIVWGFRKSHAGGYRGGYDEHMGVRVGGVWYQTSNGRTAQTGGDGDWQEIRVPAGLGNLVDGDGPGGESARGSGKPAALTLAKLLGPSGTKSLLAGVPDLSSGSAPSFTGSQDRSVTNAGRSARTDARRAGKSPEQVAKAGDDAERQAEIKVLNRQLSLAREDLSTLRITKGNTLRDFQALGRRKVGDTGRAAKAKAMAQYRAKLKAITAEMSEVREEIAQLVDRLGEIGEAIAAEQYQETYDASTPPAESPDSSPATISPDAQAQIDQANGRAATAERGSAIGSAFIRTIFGSGSIEPGQGSVNVTINTLHPGDPAIQGEVARFVAAAFGGQGSVPASSFASGA